MKDNTEQRQYSTSKFTIGSSKEDVVDAMGTPNEIDVYSSWEFWYYGNSTIKIDNENGVKGWNNSSNNLKIK